MANSINPDDVLALLEDGPKAQSDLIIWLSRIDLPDEANERLVRHGLNRLKREGHIKRVGIVGKWALASYVAPNGRPPTPGGAPRVRKYLCQGCRQKQAQHRGLCQSCAKASGMFTKALVDVARKELERGDSLLRARVDLPPTPAVQSRVEGVTLIRVIDGIEYEVVDYERLLSSKAHFWPSRGGSSLSTRES